jgi:hypothetical protein
VVSDAKKLERTVLADGVTQTADDGINNFRFPGGVAPRAGSPVETDPSELLFAAPPGGAAPADQNHQKISPASGKSSGSDECLRLNSKTASTPKAYDVVLDDCTPIDESIP